jgi:tetratricopeptide (TPR) repeat protein
MQKWFCLGLLLAASSIVWAQQDGAPPSSQSKSADSKDSSRSAPPRSDRVNADDLGSDIGSSSSKETQVDLSPPEDDEKTHPKSSEAVTDAEAETVGGKSGVTEFHVWDPHKAAKSIEVGDFYFKRKNYRAAAERYKDALRYKDNDATATFRLAQSLEKLGVLDDARSEYESYMKILPHGPEAEQAQKALTRLSAPSTETKAR